MGKMDAFSDAVRTWFLDAFDEPTDIQLAAWDSISDGLNTLVIAPTGSGKTLAAFLFAIDKLIRQKANIEEKPGSLKKDAKRSKSSWKRGVRILYISPLKALGADVERNLAKPLAEITNAVLGDTDGAHPADALVRTGMRTGDTPADERRKMLRNPPDILITTPESLYLILTSKASEILQTVDTVIVDEVHAIAGTKRGSHLSLSLERLDALLGHTTQRIGLSATVRPPEVVAKFLGGKHPVNIVSTHRPPDLDLSIRVPVDDLTAIPAFSGFGADDSSRTPDSRLGAPSIWPYLEAAILDQVLEHNSTIVFVNSRGLCERLTARLNDMYQRKCGYAPELPFETEGSVVRSSLGPSSEMLPPAHESIARAHHGSVSKELRASIEADLKSGALKCVVATSSLELGIDMGDVDLVLQVAPPLSVSSGLQRVGRANHQVGGRSRGIVFPKIRTEIVDAAVIASAMEEGAIEETNLVMNALDVLAQQTVAAVSMASDGLNSQTWLDVVRRSACFSTLPQSAYDSVLEMLAGRMATGDVTDFSPRILIDPESGMLKPLPISQRLAVTSAGTIPDRGLYPVMLSAPTGGKGRKRVGELDEEMVHESRVGDIIILGTTTWRITEITNDRVLVQPAPGRSARLPFWHGDGLGHDMELGERRGRFLRELDEAIFVPSEDAYESLEADGSETGRESDCAGKHSRTDSCLANTGATSESLPVGSGQLHIMADMVDNLQSIGLDERARRNLAVLVAEQRVSTGAVPTDRTLVLEVCPDDTGADYVILHSPFGRRVHEPWALAISARINAEYGFDPQAAASDEGILLQLPPTDAPAVDPALVLFDPEDIAEEISRAISSTSLFAARFRECAARALLMTPTQPGKRTPLWQQRLRGAQLLEEARAAGEFPILVEAARECLQDVYDLKGLRELMERLKGREIRIHTVRTETLSPFAAPMIFGYVAEHLYDGDRPATESAAAALSLDSSLLGELLGTTDVLSLLDDEVVRIVSEELQRTAIGYKARGTEGAASLLRELGPLTVAEIAARMVAPDADSEGASALTETAALAVLRELEDAHRAFEASIGGVPYWISADDAARFKTALGTTVPDWAQALLSQGSAKVAPERMLDGIIGRFARTHTLFTADEVAQRFGLGIGVVLDALGRLEADKRVRGFAVQDAEEASKQWVDSGNLKRLRLRSLAKARAAIEPVGIDAYTRFLLDIQGVLDADVAAKAASYEESLDALAQIISQFEGVALPARSWETSVFPSRVAGYKPAMLDELLQDGEVVWIGGTDASGMRTVTFYPADSPFAPAVLDMADDSFSYMVDEPADDNEPSGLRHMLSQELAAQPFMPFSTLRVCVEARTGSAVLESELADALLEALWEGGACVDSFAIVRSDEFDSAKLDGNVAPVTPRRVRSRRNGSRYPSSASAARREARARAISRAGAQDALVGNWSVPIFAPKDPTLAAMESTESLLERYGVVTSAIALKMGPKGGLSAIYPVLRAMEDAGNLLRGMFVEGLGPAQFADKYTIDDLRKERDESSSASDVRIVQADDPVNLYGAALSWPVRENASSPKRVAGAYVVFVDGHLALYSAPNMKWLLVYSADEAVVEKAVGALVNVFALIVKREGSAGQKRKLVVESVNGDPVLDTPFGNMLQRCGLIRDTHGYRLLVSPF